MPTAQGSAAFVLTTKCAFALNGPRPRDGLATLKSSLIITKRVKPMTKAPKRPVNPIHPGAVLADELSELNITQAEFARQIGVQPNRISQLIAGKRAMTAETALRLQERLGVEAVFWMNLQSIYELDIATEKYGEEIKRTSQNGYQALSVA